MDLDDLLAASDPAPHLSDGAHAAIRELVATTEASISTKRHGRRLALVGGMAGTLLVGAGVANASGVPVLGFATSQPAHSCTIPLTNAAGQLRTELTVTRDQHGLMVLKSVIASQSARVRVSGAAPSSKSPIDDLVRRLVHAQRTLGIACPK